MFGQLSLFVLSCPFSVPFACFGTASLYSARLGGGIVWLDTGQVQNSVRNYMYVE